jgi:hypothetical protein
MGVASTSLILVMGLVLTGCGPLGDDDEDPTATSETVSQSGEGTEVSEETAATGTPAGTESTSDRPPAFIKGTPTSPTEAGLAATPQAGETSLVATPATDEGTGSPAASPITSTGDQSTSPDASEATFTGSDGTSGATPVGDGGTSASESSPGVATPDPNIPFFVAEEATPPPLPPGATPQVGELADLEPLPVSSCEPEGVPAFNGEQTEFLTTTDVNFRTGPGSDCDPIGDGPIGQNIPVTILAGPVVREGEEEFAWVQVQIADQTGWVVSSVLEPAP